MTTTFQLDEKDITAAIIEWMERNGKIKDGEKGSVLISHGENDRGGGCYYTASVVVKKA